jgi:signal transduction histidine kinase
VDQHQKDELEALRRENEELKAALRQTTRESNEYLQNVAHQLTAPLGAIKWSIEALKNKDVPFARKVGLLSSIYSQATILVHLIKNFALMSNLEADHELGQLRQKPETVDPLLLAINLANDFEPQAGDGGKHIEVDHSSFDDVVKGKKLIVDKNLIAQALSNLLENAVKYSDSNTSIYLNAVAVQFQEKKPAGIGIRVANTGIPIQSTEIQKLQDRGFRGAVAKQKVPAGTGIGLYLAKRIMALHDGTIKINGNGKESQFTLVFPPSKLI